ncbi:Histone H1-like nucleoprotein HC2 [Candidatus Nanopelagicaceae bacterium]
MNLSKFLKKTVAAATLSVLSIGMLSTPSYAATSTHAIRLVKAESAGFAWILENKAAQADYTNFVQYYTPAVKLLMVIAPVGGTLNLKWKVTDAQGAALPNADVTLVLNPAYTNGDANTLTEDGQKIPLTKNGTKDSLDLPLKTDANGFVTYTITNMDTTGDKNIPNDGVTVPDWQSAFRYTQIQLWVGKFASFDQRNPVQKTQDQDILEIHFTEGVKAEKAGMTAAEKAAAEKAAAEKAAADKEAAEKAAAEKAAADKEAAEKAAAEKVAAEKAAAEKEAAEKAAANMTQAEKDAAEKAAAEKAAADKAAAEKAAADKAAADKAAADKEAAEKAAADKVAADKAAADKEAAEKAAADKLVKQTISSIASSIKVGKSLTLPARSVSGLAIKWVSNTKTTCTISGSKLTGKKKGSCSITGKNAGNSNNAALSITKKLTVK